MKWKLSLTAVVLLFTGALWGQSLDVEKRQMAVQRPNHITFSPFYFFDGTFMLNYERLFPMGAIRVTPSIKLQNISDQYYTQREGWGLDVGYKFFISGNPRRVNVYIGPYTLYKRVTTKEAYDMEGQYSTIRRYRTDSYNILGIGVDSGVKFIFGRATIDISFGGGIRYAYMNGRTFENSSSEWFEFDYKGIVPRGNVSFGVAF